jgi:hypothetical protein
MIQQMLRKERYMIKKAGSRNISICQQEVFEEN